MTINQLVEHPLLSEVTGSESCVATFGAFSLYLTNSLVTQVKGRS